MDPVYETVSKSETFTSYRPVRQTSSNLISHVNPSTPVRRRARSSRILLHWISHILSLLWIAPIATLLWLNFSHHVIGASAWCPSGNCNAEGNSENAVERANKLDRQDHNVNGALQFVAKALEVWFMFVATSLVYDMGIMFAKKGRGLPVGYLLTHLEFGDIRYIVNPLLWTSPLPRSQGVPEKRSRIIKLYIFACITAMLTILANLMGPAAAVLVLPTLQWVDTPRIMHETFHQTAVAQRPHGEDLFPGCSAERLSNGNYSCTSDTYGPSLDEWASHNAASSRQFAQYDDGTIILGASQEAALAFTINGSASYDTVWIPSRQVLRNMSHNFQKLRGAYVELDPPEYPDREFNNSLQTILQRQGPSLGFHAAFYIGNASDYGLSDGRWVRCLTGWTPGSIFWTDTQEEYTKCFRLVSVQDRETYGKFSLGNFNDPDDETSTQSGVGVFVADRAAFYNEREDFGSGLIDCLIKNNPDGTGEACDWDKIFATEWPADFRNRSIEVGVTSYSVPGENYTDARVWCEHVIFQSFPTYSVDTSPRSNVQNLVMLNDLPKIQKDTVPLRMNPAWLLAAWSVDYDGELDGERQIVKELNRVLPVTYSDGLITLQGIEFALLHFYALGQALSMVNYYSSAPPSSPSSAPTHQDPILLTYATIHVWAYGISGRTSILGVAVVGLGAMCVLARFLIGLSTGIQERSTVEVLAAAFEHRHQGEFEGLEEERHLAKVRYQVVEDGEGKQRFLPEKRTARWSNAVSL